MTSSAQEGWYAANRNPAAEYQLRSEKTLTQNKNSLAGIRKVFLSRLTVFNHFFKALRQRSLRQLEICLSGLVVRITCRPDVAMIQNLKMLVHTKNALKLYHRPEHR